MFVSGDMDMTQMMGGVSMGMIGIPASLNGQLNNKVDQYLKKLVEDNDLFSVTVKRAIPEENNKSKYVLLLKCVIIV